MDDARGELERLERAGWDSLCDGTAADFYGRTMTDDGLMVLANGMVMTRDEVVSSLGGAPPWSSYRISDLRTVSAGADSVALVYRGTAQRGDEPPYVMAMSSHYVRHGEDWRLALYTQTPVPD